MNIILINPDNHDQYKVPGYELITVLKLFRFGIKDLERYLGLEVIAHNEGRDCYLLPYDAYTRFCALKNSPYRKTIIAAWYAQQEAKK